MKKAAHSCRSICVFAFAMLLSTAFCGCCLEYKEKPGLVLRGDWSVEMNRTKAIERTKEIIMHDSGDGSPHRLRKRRHGKGHKSPCGRFGCLRCALGPMTVDEMLEQDLEFDDEETDDEEENLMMPDPKQFGKLHGYSMLQPGMMGYGMWTPGMMAPQGGIAMAPVPVINPNNGQQMVVQPALPGQPGMMMLHALSGQPIMVNPYAQPLTVPSGGLLAGANGPTNPAQGQSAQNEINQAAGRLNPPAPPNGTAQNDTAGNTGNPYANGVRPFYGFQAPFGMPPYGAMPYAMPPQVAMQHQLAMQAYAMRPYGISPYGVPMFAPMYAPMGIAAINPYTGMIVPNPYGQYPYGIPTNALAQNQQNSEEEPNSEKRTPMPTPKYHPVPSKPVFQRTEGLATNQESEEEIRLKNLRLERALGMKVPEGARVADNGINQQIIQASAVSRRNGGGPLVGNPFQSISGILGISDESEPVKTAQVRSPIPSETTKPQKPRNDWLGISSSRSQSQTQPPQAHSAQLSQRRLNNSVPNSANSNEATLDERRALAEKGIILNDGETLVKGSLRTVKTPEDEYEEEAVPQNSLRLQQQIQQQSDQEEDRQVWENLFENTKGLGFTSKQMPRPSVRRTAPSHQGRAVAKNEGSKSSITGKITSLFTPQKPASKKVCRPCPPPARRQMIAQSVPNRRMIVQNRSKIDHLKFESEEENDLFATNALEVITTDNITDDMEEIDADFDLYADTSTLPDDLESDEFENGNQLVQLEPDAELPLLLTQKKLRTTNPVSTNESAVFKKKEEVSNEIVQIRFQNEPRRNMRNAPLQQTIPEL